MKNIAVQKDRRYLFDKLAPIKTGITKVLPLGQNKTRYLG